MLQVTIDLWYFHSICLMQTISDDPVLSELKEIDQSQVTLKDKNNGKIIGV